MDTEKFLETPEYMQVYCPRCGWLNSREYIKECMCYHEMLPIDSKWKIPCKEYDELFWIPRRDGNATLGECITNVRLKYRDFFNNCVKNHPDFDRWYFDHITEVIENFQADSHKHYEAEKKFGYVPKCPYCQKDHRPRESDHVYEAKGLMNKIRGKRWYCPRCKNFFA